jgi:DNA-binding transcriptional regulator GbsR (MarR family)
MSSETTEISPVVRRFIQDAGSLSQSFGLGRVIGQLYAYLYFSQGPRNLSDMQRALSISKGSASMAVRQLEQWGAARKVWVKGDRKDYYEAEDWLGRILKNAALDTVGKRMESWTRLLDEADDYLVDHNGGPDKAFIKERLDHLRAFQKRARKLWGNPIVQKLLK